MVTDYMSCDLGMMLQALKADERLSKYQVKVAWS
jgi:hypothetical protein